MLRIEAKKRAFAGLHCAITSARYLLGAGAGYPIEGAKACATNLVTRFVLDAIVRAGCLQNRPNAQALVIPSCRLVLGFVVMIKQRNEPWIIVSYVFLAAEELAIALPLLASIALRTMHFLVLILPALVGLFVGTGPRFAKLKGPDVSDFDHFASFDRLVAVRIVSRPAMPRFNQARRYRVNPLRWPSSNSGLNSVACPLAGK